MEAETITEHGTISGPYYAIEREDGTAEVRSRLHNERHIMAEIDKARELAIRYNAATHTYFTKGA